MGFLIKLSDGTSSKVYPIKHFKAQKYTFLLGEPKFLTPKTRSPSRRSRASLHEREPLYYIVEDPEKSDSILQRDTENFRQDINQIRLEVVDLKTEIHLQLSSIENLMKIYFESNNKKDHSKRRAWTQTSVEELSSSSPQFDYIYHPTRSLNLHLHGNFKSSTREEKKLQEAWPQVTFPHEAKNSGETSAKNKVIIPSYFLPKK
ncbi:hypothetical protein OnM2_066064 [Erysiphe neolycopersici]|uniref:Uncharacterized protein n=1 Tax=Erysiphe neolycopersici TaxID=212602 RepID=A0A420HMM4_9PEZI|nr:hypothetical protein OnM2_066064 [Erysiphe neolycopersici]